MEISVENIGRLCRICLKEGESKELCSILEETVAAINLKDILYLFIQDFKEIDDSLVMPQNCCIPCRDQLVQLFLFKQRIEQNYHRLRNILYASTTISIKTDNSLDSAEEDEHDTLKIRGYADLTCNLCDDSRIVFNTAKDLQYHVDNSHSGRYLDECKPCTVLLVNNVDPILTHGDEDDDKGEYKPKKSKRSRSNKEEDQKSIVSYTKQLEYSAPNEKQIWCRICNNSFDKISEIRKHLQKHAEDPASLVLALPLASNPHLIDLESVDLSVPEVEKLALTLCTDLSQGTRMDRFYEISNGKGYEFELNDSDTEDEESSLANHKCSLCNKSFNRLYKTMAHMRDHIDDNSELLPTCSHCHERFPNTSILERHLRTHCLNSEKKIDCSVCKMKFMWKNSLEQHRVHAHAKLVVEIGEKRKYQCTICSKLFNRSEHLDRHLKIHISSEKKFECETCHKKFNRNDNLRSHLKVHKPVKDDNDKHLCVYCGRSFSNSSNLIVHMRRHTGEKPYRCDLCDKGFPRSSDLQCHRRTHTGEKPCLCTICGKGFSRSNKLVRHMRIHTGSRPYKCTYCERAFTQSNDLTLHIRRHTGDKPYVCGVCGTRFIQGTALAAHRRMQGHYEDVQTSPFSSISVNNPNRFTNSKRVNRIGREGDSKQAEVDQPDIPINDAPSHPDPQIRPASISSDQADLGNMASQQQYSNFEISSLISQQYQHHFH